LIGIPVKINFEREAKVSGLKLDMLANFESKDVKFKRISISNS